MNPWHFSLDQSDLNAISEALAELPYKQVYQTINKLQAQINQQLAPPAPADAPPAPVKDQSKD